MKEPVKVSVVFSFYNEEEVLEELVTRVRRVFMEQLHGVVATYELIFVNDASTDHSLEVLKNLAEGFGDIRIVNMSRNFGISPCVQAGMSHASGDAVIYMDADLQDPPELIPKMVEHWLSGGADVVHTRRLSRAGEPRFKMFLTRIGYRILNRVSNVNIQPQVGDFKLLSRRVVRELSRLRERNPFMRGLVSWVGFSQVTLDYHRDARHAGDTKCPVTSWKVIGNFLDSALISFSDVPLKLSLLLGFLVSFGAFGYLVVIFVMKYMGWSLPGWSAIMATMLFLGGVGLFSIGVMGLYISAIYIETKDRPPFIVESTWGFKDRGGQNGTRAREEETAISETRATDRTGSP